MHRFRLLLPLLLILPLAGCYAGQQKQLVSCEASAAAAFPKPVAGQPFKAIQSCMDGAGYAFIGWRDGVVCDMGAVIRGKSSPTGGDVICFEPKNWLDLKFYRLLEVPEKAQSTAS